MPTDQPLTKQKRARGFTMAGKEVRDVPPDWVGRVLPMVDELAVPEIAWWARHPNGRFTPVFVGSRHPFTGKVER